MVKALVTGATSGIRLEFTYQLAQKGYDLILVSRNINRLNETAQALTSKYKVKAEVLKADLGTDEGIKLTRELINKDEIEFVVNNAGLGINKPFHSADLAEEVKTALTKSIRVIAGETDKN